jgi:phenylacetate-CoA ligase
VFGSLAYRANAIWMQELLIAAHSSLRGVLREGRAFARIARELEATQWWSAEDLRALQRHTLRRVLETAARDVPWYRSRYRDLGIDPATLELPEGMAQLPLIAKGDVREGGSAFLSERRLRPLFAAHTSGTTGAPLSLYQDLPAINRENAFIRRQLAWAGLAHGERRAWIRGDMIVPAEQKTPPYWRFDRGENRLMLSSYHLSEPAARDYVEALAGFDPVVIQAYPSSIGFLAGWMLASGVRHGGRALRGIVTSSETLSQHARREIELAFGCRVFDWYGQGERVAAIGTCEQGRHHLLTDYSYVELLPAEDGLCELVGTGFHNYSMPLVRYRCGDLVRPAPAGGRCACGRAFPLIDEVIGRRDDAVRLPDGRSIGRLDHLFKGVEGILEAQIRQDRIDALRILIVPAAGFGEKTRQTLEENFRLRLGPGIALETRVVDAIPRTANGKFKGVVCNL